MSTNLTYVLSPDLYARLAATFPGGVVVSNEGVPMIGNFVNGPRGREFQVYQFGETYRINCPFCRESRHRLWINHRFGQPNPVNPERMIDYWCTCFNNPQGCVSLPENRRQFFDWLFKLRNRNERVQLRLLPAANELGPPPQAVPPGRLDTIDRFPHAANYLIGRGYGPDVWNYYGLRYVVEVDNPDWRCAQGRIYAPIWFEGQYRGWQTRYVGEPPFKSVPKYYTMPGSRKSTLLYNYDQSKLWPFVVVFEGITDVWRLGPPGVALLGKSLSYQQRTLLQQTWERKPIVIVLDPDAREESEGILHEMITTGHNPIVLVDLPNGMDPGDFDRQALWNIIYAQAERVGVHLPRV